MLYLSTLLGINYKKTQQTSRNSNNIGHQIQSFIVSSSPKLDADKVSKVLNSQNKENLNDEMFICEICNRQCASKQGLGSHKRVHNRK